MRGGSDRRSSSDTAPVRRSSFLDAYEATLPAVHRYLYRSTGGDGPLTEELTGATFLAAARAFRSGDAGSVRLGSLHEEARTLLVDRALRAPDLAAGPRSDQPPGGGDPPGPQPVPALGGLRLDHRVVLALRGHDDLPPPELARVLGTTPDRADALVAEALAALRAADPSGAAPDDDLRALFADLDAHPAPAFAAGLRARLQQELAPARRAARSAAAVADDGRDELMPVAAGSRAGEEPARRGTGRWRRWAAPAVVLAAAVAVVVATSGPDPGDRQSGSGPAPTLGDGPSPTTPVPPTAPSAVLLAPTPLGAERPPAGTQAEVVDRVRVGPGGAYMNGPYVVAYGPEGVWATAVDDAGTWRAVRIDPATGDVVAELRVPGRMPTDRRHHGVAVSGGYVWVPAIRDGLFRIDAATNTPSGIVAVSGGLDGSTLAGGDGAVWVVGNDGVLRRIDAVTTEVTAQAIVSEMGRMPGGMDLAYGGGAVWVTVAAPEGRHLIAFDPTTLTRRSHVLVPPVGPLADPYDLAATGDLVVLTERSPGGITVVDGAAGRILSQHQFSTAGIAVDDDLAWVPSPGEGLATAVRPSTGELVATAAVPPGLDEMVAIGDGTVWATVPAEGELVRLRLPR